MKAVLNKANKMYDRNENNNDNNNKNRSIVNTY